MASPHASPIRLPPLPRPAAISPAPGSRAANRKALHTNVPPTAASLPVTPRAHAAPTKLASIFSSAGRNPCNLSSRAGSVKPPSLTGVLLSPPLSPKAHSLSGSFKEHRSCRDRGLVSDALEGSAPPSPAVSVSSRSSTSSVGSVVVRHTRGSQRTGAERSEHSSGTLAESWGSVELDGVRWGGRASPAVSSRSGGDMDGGDMDSGDSGPRRRLELPTSRLSARRHGHNGGASYVAGTLMKPHGAASARRGSRRAQEVSAAEENDCLRSACISLCGPGSTSSATYSTASSSSAASGPASSLESVPVLAVDALDLHVLTAAATEDDSGTATGVPGAAAAARSASARKDRHCRTISWAGFWTGGGSWQERLGRSNDNQESPVPWCQSRPSPALTTRAGSTVPPARASSAQGSKELCSEGEGTAVTAPKSGGEGGIFRRLRSRTLSKAGTWADGCSAQKPFQNQELGRQGDIICGRTQAVALTEFEPSLIDLATSRKCLQPSLTTFEVDVKARGHHRRVVTSLVEGAPGVMSSKQSQHSTTLFVDPCDGREGTGFCNHCGHAQAQDLGGVALNTDPARRLGKAFGSERLRIEISVSIATPDVTAEGTADLAARKVKHRRTMSWAGLWAGAGRGAPADGLRAEHGHSKDCSTKEAKESKLKLHVAVNPVLEE